MMVEHQRCNLLFKPPPAIHPLRQLYFFHSFQTLPQRYSLNLVSLSILLHVLLGPPERIASQSKSPQKYPNLTTVSRIIAKNDKIAEFCLLHAMKAKSMMAVMMALYSRSP